MAIVLSIFSVFYIVLFIASLALFYVFYKKQNYKIKHIFQYVITIILASITGFIVANHMAMIGDNNSVVASIGYAAIPITQASILLISYSVVQWMNKAAEKKIIYAPIFLGTVSSMSISFLMTLTVSKYYWAILGKNIYG